MDQWEASIWDSIYLSLFQELFKFKNCSKRCPSQTALVYRLSAFSKRYCDDQSFRVSTHPEFVAVSLNILSPHRKSLFPLSSHQCSRTRSLCVRTVQSHLLGVGRCAGPQCRSPILYEGHGYIKVGFASCIEASRLLGGTRNGVAIYRPSGSGHHRSEERFNLSLIGPQSFRTRQRDNIAYHECRLTRLDSVIAEVII